MRDVAYVRPGRFVVYDRTTVPSGSADQWMAWHVPGTPAQSTSSDGTPRFDVSTGGTLRALMPAARVATVNLMSGVATRIELHASAPTQDWMTSVTVGESPDVVRMSTADGNVTSGTMVGAHVLGATRESVVLFSGDHAGVAASSGADYAVAQTADADHLLFDMAPSASGYTVTATPDAGKLDIHVAAGGPLQLTPNGTLAFTLSASGVVAAAAPPPGSTTASSSTVARPMGALADVPREMPVPAIK